MELRIYQFLRLSTVPMELRGGKFLFAAIKLCLENEIYMESITKLLYPKIAEMFETTPACIEKNIREAIFRAWKCGLKDFFQSNFIASDKKPSNGVFIKKIVILINML
ncbi:MAG: sporulation initiation factor Spo0A C-terminal domain-containing protein [Eubacteriales bacterium]